MYAAITCASFGGGCQQSSCFPITRFEVSFKDVGPLKGPVARDAAIETGGAMSVGMSLQVVLSRVAFKTDGAVVTLRGSRHINGNTRPLVLYFWTQGKYFLGPREISQKLL